MGSLDVNADRIQLNAPLFDSLSGAAKFARETRASLAADFSAFPGVARGVYNAS